MKKLLAPVAGALAACQMLVGRAFAQLPTTGLNDISGLETGANVHDVITNIITAILDFILIIAVLYVIIAGIRLIVSGGDEAQKDKSKQTIIYVVAGIVIILLARVIVVAANTLFSSGA